MDKAIPPMISAKRLLWLAVFSVFVSCSMHEEYTPPSPIELKPPKTQPSVYDREIETDKFGDEGLEPIDEDEKLEDFDPRAERQMRIQDDIANAERRNRAKKLTDTARKNIKIERKTAGHILDSAPKKPKAKTEEKPVTVTPKPEPKKVSENLDSDDLEDFGD